MSENGIPKGKVVVGMSGGLDSTVTAYILKTRGYEVIGVTLYLYDDVNSPKSCCTLDAINRARAMAVKLGIRHYTIDLREFFKGSIIRFFIDGYSEGITPNPCVLCNRIIKFEHLIEFANKVNAQYVATGHYARIKDGKIYRAFDRQKDQSYFLALVKKKHLSRIVFPLGDMTKEEVKTIAYTKELVPRTLVESQDICFVGNGDYRKFLEKIVDKREGKIVDKEGNVVGVHQGIYRYTLGQRRGLNISSTTPLYVVKINPERNEIVVGDYEDLLKKTLKIGALNLQDDLEVGELVEVMIRSRHQPAKAHVVELNDDRCTIEFVEPQWNPTPGQLAAIYKGDQLIGGGFILKDD